MKNILLVLVGVLLLAACSTPKYAYYFDHYDYNSGKKKAFMKDGLTAVEPVSRFSSASASPLKIDQRSAAASIESDVIAETAPASPVASKSVLERKYSSLSTTEKKEFRKELKTAMKEYAKLKKEGKSVAAAQALDYNLKMAIIFGAVALTLSFFGGVNSIFWIVSVIALVVGVVFFIKWIAEQ